MTESLHAISASVQLLWLSIQAGYYDVCVLGKYHRSIVGWPLQVGHLVEHCWKVFPCLFFSEYNCHSDKFLRLEAVVIQLTYLHGIPAVQVKGYRSLNTCLPPHWDKPINLGPVTESLLRALPPTDPALNKVFDTCAIVGSSGHLLKFEKGVQNRVHDKPDAYTEVLS
eukprot:424913-Prorocentrum_minimum.AAC.1